MIWNKELLFLHPQKTAGMALTKVLLETLSPPVFNSLPPGHWPDPTKGTPGTAYVYGQRHENLYAASMILNQFNLTLGDFHVIMVVMRNPYDMEISRYFHLRKPEAFEKNSERDLALQSTFSTFVLNSQFRKKRPHNRKLEQSEAIKNYYTTTTSLPDNLMIVRYERLEDDVNSVLGSLGYPEITIPAVNISAERKNKTITDLITSPEVEASIYNRYAWIFDNNFYPRIKFDVQGEN